MSASSAGALLDAAWAGSTEVLGALDALPLLVVELGTDDDVVVALPPWLPCVVVAVAHSIPTGPAPVGVDVAVCVAGDGGAAPSGWVGVADPPAELDRLAVQVRASPQPAVVLAQLLRGAGALDVGTGLLAESLAYSTLQSGPAFTSWLARRPLPTGGSSEEAPVVLVERAGQRLTVTLQRPRVRNAVSAGLRDELADALAVAAGDPSITGVELRGAGPDFSSGGDLTEFGTSSDAASAHLIRTARSPARLLAALSDRVVAHVHGACIGAGIELAAFAGQVLAAGDARFQLPELDMGLIPGSGGTVSIPRRIGRHRAAWLALSGATVDAATAARWGLVDEVVERG